MSTNRRRNAKTVPLASMAMWITVCVFIGVAGLSYVWLKNQLHASNGEIISLEREITELATQNEVVRTHIAELSSTAALRKRYMSDKGKLNGLVEIPQDKLVFVG